MASTSSPQKKLSEFLNEEQEPFILEHYLLERGCSRKWNSTHQEQDSGRSLERSASSVSNKKRKALLLFSQVLTSLCKNLAAHRETPVTIDSDNRDEDIISLPQIERFDQKVVETERFSSASSSTLFNSCSEIEEIEEETWISSHKDQPSFISDSCRTASNACNIAVKSQQATRNGKHRRRYIEHSPALLDRIHPRKVQLSQNKERVKEDVGRTEQRILDCRAVFMPKKVTEDSLLSAAFWGLLIQSADGNGHNMDLEDIIGTNVSQVLKSKRALHKTKQLLFDCVREIAASFPRTDEGQTGNCKQLLGAEELGNLICQKMKEWGQQAGDQTNLTYLLTSDHLKSIKEWSDFEPHMKDISFEVADSILDCINHEIVTEMLDLFTPSI